MFWKKKLLMTISSCKLLMKWAKYYTVKKIILHAKYNWAVHYIVLSIDVFLYLFYNNILRIKSFFKLPVVRHITQTFHRMSRYWKYFYFGTIMHPPNTQFTLTLSQTHTHTHTHTRETFKHLLVCGKLFVMQEE